MHHKARTRCLAPSTRSERVSHGWRDEHRQGPSLLLHRAETATVTYHDGGARGTSQPVSSPYASITCITCITCPNQQRTTTHAEPCCRISPTDLVVTELQPFRAMCGMDTWAGKTCAAMMTREGARDLHVLRACTEFRAFVWVRKHGCASGWRADRAQNDEISSREVDEQRFSSSDRQHLTTIQSRIQWSLRGCSSANPWFMPHTSDPA